MKPNHVLKVNIKGAKIMFSHCSNLLFVFWEMIWELHMGCFVIVEFLLFFYLFFLLFFFVVCGGEEMREGKRERGRMKEGGKRKRENNM